MNDGLIVDNLNYGILNNISFSLKESTFTALIGKGGSGKTSLLRCISGLCEHSGNIIISGNVITKSSKMNENIGIFTELFTLVDGTGFENIMEPLSYLGLSLDKIKKKVYDISKKLGIESLIYKNINVLSYSEKKMIAIAKSIVHEPSVIMLDNVFDSLDLYYKNKLISYLKSIKKGIIIFTTNNSEDLMLADNIIILKDGKIIENSARDDLFIKENVFIKNGFKLPFIIDLSHKLQSYELVDHLIYSNEDMVNELWK